MQKKLLKSLLISSYLIVSMNFTDFLKACDGGCCELNSYPPEICSIAGEVASTQVDVLYNQDYGDLCSWNDEDGCVDNY
jgi:hypothetical protein